MNADVEAVVLGNSAFALDLFAKLRSAAAANLFFSPSSIATALAMTYAGARGLTRAQMAAVLHFDLPDERLHPAFAALARTLTEGGQAGYRLHVANRLWGQEGYHFLREFLRLTQEQYGAELALVDFVGDTEGARRTINAWVEERTEQKVKELLARGVLTPFTVLVLTNAIYFRGTWASQFRKGATAEAPFTPSDRETVPVPMMYQRGRFPYRNAESVQVLELPYAGHDLSMLVLLPERRNGLADVERRLTPAQLRQWTAPLPPQAVDVFLPVFAVTSAFDLAKVLPAMGMPLAFTGEADFSGMTGQRDLCISAVIHKAHADVSEEGTEAAAATAVVMSRGAAQPIPVFRADHPFLFLIRDNRTGGILFFGRVVNPKA